jgi:hypothetical protein
LAFTSQRLLDAENEISSSNSTSSAKTHFFSNARELAKTGGTQGSFKG